MRPLGQQTEVGTGRQGLPREVTGMSKAEAARRAGGVSLQKGQDAQCDRRG